MLTLEQRLPLCKSYGVGTKAFIDSLFGGMIRCVVVEIHKPKANGIRVDHDEISVKVEENKGGYHKGEIVKRSAAYTPPRQQRYTQGAFYRINTAYKYE
jgi:hypothetical protein